MAYSRPSVETDGDEQDERLLRVEEGLRRGRALNRVLALAIVGVSIACGITWVRPVIKERDLVAAQVEALRQQVVAQKTDVQRQARIVALLQSDPEYLALHAREKLDVAREGETIMRVEGGKVERVNSRPVAPVRD